MFVLALWATGVDALEQGSEEEEIPTTAVTGTIAEKPTALISAVFGSNQPAQFQGIVFKLKEHQDMTFIFHSDSFEYRGRSLLDDLTGSRVEVACESWDTDDPPDESECNTLDLQWLDAPPAHN